MVTFYTILTSLVFAGLFLSGTTVTKAPQGTESVPNLRNTFLDKSEVTNRAWLDYLGVLLEEQDTGAYLSALPDTALWKQSYPAPFFQPGNYATYPVVGLGYDQALQYCSWRSRYISEREKREITYSLPNFKVYQMLRDVDQNKVAEGLYSTKLGFRVFLGICDNASEMLDQEGMAVMGSERTRCLDTLNYFLPSRTLGFRCMATVK